MSAVWTGTKIVWIIWKGDSFDFPKGALEKAAPFFISGLRSFRTLAGGYKHGHTFNSADLVYGRVQIVLESAGFAPDS
jgi:hypothetical protein